MPMRRRLMTSYPLHTGSPGYCWHCAPRLCRGCRPCTGCSMRRCTKKTHRAALFSQHRVHRDRSCPKDLLGWCLPFLHNSPAGKNPNTIPTHCLPYRTARRRWGQMFARVLWQQSRPLLYYGAETIPGICWRPIVRQVSVLRPSNIAENFFLPGLHIPTRLR